MTEEAEPGEQPANDPKSSRRGRFKDALQRTKNKLKSHDKAEQQDYSTGDDFSDFLQAGRPSTASSVATSDVLYDTSTNFAPDHSEHPAMERVDGISQDSGASPFAQPIQKPLISSSSRNRLNKQDKQEPKKGVITSRNLHEFLNTGRPTSADSLPHHPSPRRIVVPRIDVSKSPRWPNQQPLGEQNEADCLDIPKNIRSRSHSAISRRAKPRNLSVSFADVAPTIIGEGGDEAEAPPMAISRARARSASPMPWKGADSQREQHQHQHQHQHHSTARPAEEADYTPRPLARAPTGGWSLSAKSDFDKEFEMSLQPGPAPALLVTAPSAPVESERKHSLKPSTASNDLRMQFEEGRALREARHRAFSNASILDETTPPPPPPPPAQQHPSGFEALSLDGATPRSKENMAILSSTRTDSSIEDSAPPGWI